jgi:hypothetical protein
MSESRPDEPELFPDREGFFLGALSSEIGLFGFLKSELVCGIRRASRVDSNGFVR